MAKILLASCTDLPTGEPGDHLIDAALKARGHEVGWSPWDDPATDWAAADLVTTRATWDYPGRHEEFLAWVRSVEDSTRLLNGAAIIEWNSDKAYLRDLTEHVRAIETELVDRANLASGLELAFEQWGTVVIKPRVGGGGAGVVVADALDDPRLDELGEGPFVVQPLVDSVRTRGEISIFLFGGEPVAQVDKLPGGTEIRVHEEYGGSSQAAELDRIAADVAMVALEAAQHRTGTPLRYARADLMQWHEGWAISELELIEPSLYLEQVPGNAEHFAAQIDAALGD